jgi:hypothetical protein
MEMLVTMGGLEGSIGFSILKRGLRGVQDLILYAILSHLVMYLSLRSKYMIYQYLIGFKGFISRYDI